MWRPTDEAVRIVTAAANANEARRRAENVRLFRMMYGEGDWQLPGSDDDRAGDD